MVEFTAQKAEQQASADAQAQAELAERERRRLAEANLRWGGRIPARDVLEIAESLQLAQFDRALLDAVVAASPLRQREVARFAVHHAYTEAGLTGIGWIDAALDALEHAIPLPSPFNDPAAMWQALAEDSLVPSTTIRSPDGQTGWSQQHMTLPVLLHAAEADPLRHRYPRPRGHGCWRRPTGQPAQCRQGDPERRSPERIAAGYEAWVVVDDTVEQLDPLGVGSVNPRSGHGIGSFS